MKLVANPYQYRRNLPHYQKSGAAHFVTFNTQGRWELPPEARDLVMDCCRHDHNSRMELHVCVVMPDHVHLVLTPKRDDDGCEYLLRTILHRLKGTSAHLVNRLLFRQGTVWQDESFDHVLRSGENLEDTIDYVCMNPVRRGLVRHPEDYRWLWLP